ncbi:MAG TPA: LysE family translocator, partial [Desulfomonilia bacterium]|nr:LysE family translocator [Desulfomonilia bacterium]
MMVGITNYFLFVTAGITLNIIPGPDTLYILGNSIAKGRRAGFLAACGIMSGCLVHISAAALGLSVVLAKSSYAFTLLKTAGAAYLAYLGISILFAGETRLEPDETPVPTPRRVYYQGLLTNLLNPKVALFFLSFLPQFVRSNNAYGPLPFLILGVTFFTTGSIWCLALALFASRMTGFLRKNMPV